MKTVLMTLFLYTTAHCAPEFSERARNFSIELLHYTQLETNGHVVISPFGVWSLMIGVTLGATGTSRNQLVKACLLPKNSATLIHGYVNLTRNVLDPKTNGVTLSSKNFMFLDKGFDIKPDFRKTYTSDFGATVQNLDFKDSYAAADIANNLIQNTSATMYNVLLSDDFVNSRMILTSVISYRGLWSKPFNVSNTRIEPFYDENNDEVGKVNMMFLSAHLAYSSIKEMDALVLELPYGDDGKYCMLVILPYPKKKASDVYKKLEKISFPNIFDRLQRDIDEFGVDNIEVKLPRFKFNTNVVLNKPLNDMGVFDIFEPNLASFKGITNEDIYVSAIVHNAEIEVTESGTVASAATSAFFISRVSTQNFHMNRPFIYFVMHKPSATVIIGGIYSKPSIC